MPKKPASAAEPELAVPLHMANTSVENRGTLLIQYGSGRHDAYLAPNHCALGSADDRGSFDGS